MRTSRAKKKANYEKRILRRFVAGETGVKYIEDADTFDIPITKTRDPVAKSLGDVGRMTFDIAAQESKLFLQEIARARDIDPDTGETELPDGSIMTATRAAMIQQYARQYVKWQKEHQKRHGH